MAVPVAAAASGNVEFIRARSDKREYRRVVLPNALECLLISDAETDKAAACMEVGVGSFSDPEGLEGLAHFLEHMLFYASEKYPGEQDYTKYISEHGGSSNAFTSSETTNFYFDVNVDNFEEALDRFAQFFIKPLMSQDAVLREIKAVDSEHKKNLLSDGWRMYQLQKHLASKDHPYHKFSTGSWETLETKPKERGLDIRLELLKFYEKYSANLMHLVVYGKESLDCIQSLVESLFSTVKNTDQRSFKCPSQPLAAEHLQLLVKAIPITEGDYLKISWPVTPGIQFYKEGPCRYLGHLIGHEGEGSIFHIIKELGWAMDLSAGSGSDSTEYSFFSVSMRLTDSGHEHMEDIIGLVFKYLHLLKEDGIHEWIFDELVSVSETEFHYQDKVHPISYLMMLNLRVYFIRYILLLLDFRFCSITMFLPVSLGGYNDKMRVLLHAIMKQIVNFEVKPNRFSALKETSVKDYQNFNFRQPYSQASYYLSLILEEKKWPLVEKLQALSTLEADSLAKFVPHLLSKTYLECYIQGNIEPGEAESIVQEIEDTIFNTPNSLFKSMSPSQYLIKRVIMLENELKCYYQIEGLNPKNENSSIVQYIQVHQDDAISNIKLQLFSQIASQPAFNQLRTVEQLGYIAGLSLRSDRGVWALEVVIQSTVKDPSYLDVRVDEFFKTFESKIHELSDKDFKRNVKSLVDSKLEKFKNLWEEADFYWGEIEAGTLKFDRIESEVALLRELKKDEFIEFFDQYIKVDAPQRRTVSVQVFSGNHLAEFKKAIVEAEPPKTYRITDIFGFKRSRPLHRSLKGGPGRITMD
uniref:Uncharacterized protein n=1 Tax=Avena sativa TaxID=4498 RepID=A0ACD5WJT1_AVESA